MFSVEQSAVPFQELHKKSASERKLSLMAEERGQLPRPSSEDRKLVCAVSLQNITLCLCLILL